MDEAAISLAKAHLRVARPTDRLTEVVQFYRDRLGRAAYFVTQTRVKLHGTGARHATLMVTTLFHDPEFNA